VGSGGMAVGLVSKVGGIPKEKRREQSMLRKRVGRVAVRVLNKSVRLVEIFGGA